MQRIGLLSGLGPESTIDYYQGIINIFNVRAGDKEPEYPEIVVYSVNMYEFLGMMKKKEYDNATDYLLTKLMALKNAGADFAAISANTPHLLFDGLEQRSPLPLVSIVEATCTEALKRGLHRPGLFGTIFTMESSFYQSVFKRNGTDIVLPDQKDKELVNFRLFSEIELGIFKNETREELVGIIAKMVDRDHIDSIILGCTEFPLILKEEYYAGVPALNPNRIHIEAIVEKCCQAQTC